MSRDASISFDWADGRHDFRLAIGELRALQEAVNKWRAEIGAPLIGPGDLLLSLKVGNVWMDDVANIIRLGLIGGGMKPVDALAKVRHYVEARPMGESYPAAHLILGAALYGADDEPLPGKDEAVEQPTTGSPSLPSTEPEPS